MDQPFGVHEITAALNGTLLTGSAPLTASAPARDYPPLTTSADDNGDGVLLSRGIAPLVVDFVPYPIPELLSPELL